jgi:hypothetical protein
LPKKPQRTGLCRLTQTPGKFVKSHLIPLAFTKPESPGLPLIESGPGKRPIRKWTSWYDAQLVTSEGEAILQAYDGWAVSELRRHKLVWSGWGPMLRLSVEGFNAFPGTPWGVRRVTGIDPVRLRLFFLSLLWRAAASQLDGFNEVSLREAELARIRGMVVDAQHEPFQSNSPSSLPAESFIISRQLLKKSMCQVLVGCRPTTLLSSASTSTV